MLNRKLLLRRIRIDMVIMFFLGCIFVHLLHLAFDAGCQAGIENGVLEGWKDYEERHQLYGDTFPRG